ncbi:flavodoxin domain-containing protein [Kitasatospora sp. NPDC093679]|uniref:flavodoxin domain-containing protein n=1 Tax=Kitasatospora sp. NPDC093679 TaxID=3154983 RepID=UPI0034407BF1
MTQQRVLVAYGTKHGATAGIAEEIGRVLGAEGFTTEVRPAAEVTTVAGFDAVVLGSALHMNRWQRDALRCVHRHADELARRPVWLFSSGPVDSSAEQYEIPGGPGGRGDGAPARARARDLRRQRDRRDTGFVARSMVRHDKGGDFRSPEQIGRWARQVGADLWVLEGRGCIGS